MRHEAARLSEYLEGALSVPDAVRVERHLADCPACRRELGELRRTVDLLRELRGNVDSPDVAGLVIERIRRGEAEPSALDRVRAAVARFLSTPLGAPLATACIGLALLAVLPRIEVEVSIPGRAATPTDASAPHAATGTPQGSRDAHGPLLARRVNESLGGPPRYLAGRAPFACFESSGLGICREHNAFMMRLAMENAWAFMAELEEVPEPRRDDWLIELSRFAAQAGAASDVAERLRATGDPEAQQIAIRFEQAR